MMGLARVGIVHDGLIYDLHDAIKRSGLPLSEDSTIERILGDGVLPAVQKATDKIVGTASGTPVESVKLLSPILNPEKILLMAVNYHSHSKEWSKNPSVPTEPYMFTKFRNTLIGPEDPVLLPRISRKADW
jgi:2-keto-4-pentenoate hydratase/2-oxohepta-3-ene-1,7-dioic acid hydratase in catechol pathway